MKCAKCGTVIPDGKNFCVECGEHLPEKFQQPKVRKCAKCGSVIPDGKNFCVECGEHLPDINDMICADGETIGRVFVVIALGSMVFGGIALMICFPVWWGYLSGCVISGWCFAALLRAVGVLKLPGE